MMEVLLEWDRAVFLWINQGLTNPVFDVVLPVLRDKLIWIPVYVFILSVILFNTYGRKTLLYILLVASTMTLSDTMSSKLIKPSVERVRPCNDSDMQPLLTLRARCGGGYSFTSSHATNHFALSTILFLILGSRFTWRWVLFAWAGLIAFAQVYVGVHYPLDIVFGGFLGILLAATIYKGYLWLFGSIE